VRSTPKIQHLRGLQHHRFTSASCWSVYTITVGGLSPATTTVWTNCCSWTMPSTAWSRLPSLIWDAAVSLGCWVAAFDCRPAAYYVVRHVGYLCPRHDRPVTDVSCFSAQHQMRHQQPALCGHITSLSRCYHAALTAVGNSHSTGRWPEVYCSFMSCDQAMLCVVGTLDLASFSLE